MTLAITHTFVSAKGDGTDATLVRPSNWNAAHTTSMANNNLLGNNSGGTGPILELPASALIIAALNSADGPTFLSNIGVGGFSSGDVKHSINPTPPTGWISYQGTATIGNASSGATARANADTLNLYTIVWNNTANADCPVSGGRGANAAADFAANKTIQLPWLSGRTVIGAGVGGSLTTRTNGTVYGEESHALIAGEIPSITSNNAAQNIVVFGPNGHTVYADATISSNNASGGGNSYPVSGVNSSSLQFSGSNAISVTSNNTGGASHNNMQPSVALWTHMKL